MENWVQHMQFIVLMATMIGGVYVIDGKVERQVATQSQRTDKLYEMFVELVKTTKK